MNAFHIRTLGCKIVNPDVDMIEQCRAKRRYGSTPQRRYPQEQESVNVHAISGKPENPFIHKRKFSVLLIEMIDAESAPETEISYHGVKQICRRD